MQSIRYAACLASPFLLASLGCEAWWVGGGVLFPTDGSIQTGWQAEVFFVDVPLPIGWDEDGCIMRTECGYLSVDDAQGHVGFVDAVVPFWFAGKYPLTWEFEAGTGLVWSEDDVDIALVLDARLTLQKYPVMVQLAYAWRPVDMAVSGRDISDAGGVSAIVQYAW